MLDHATLATAVAAIAPSAALGAAVGLVMALTGAGGGILAVPLLVFGLHLPLPQAAPTGLIAVGAAAALAAVLGLYEGIVRYRAAGFMSIFGVALAPVGVWLAARLPATPSLLGFAALLAWVSWRSWRPVDGKPADAAEGASCRLDPSQRRLRWTGRCARALAATGSAAGLLSGLFGVGGGFVIIPALQRATNLDLRSIQATSLAVIALVSTSGVVAAAASGALDWGVALPFGAGAVVALLVGRRWARRLPAPLLRRVFGVLTFVVALMMLARALGWRVG
jgi:uncharacterized membrane protein YfcA